MSRLGRIFDNLMDLLVIGGKLGVEYLIEGVNALSWIWKEDHLTPPIENDEVMWNGGGVDNKTTSETSEAPINEIHHGEQIIYDGVYDDLPKVNKDGRINE